MVRIIVGMTLKHFTLSIDYSKTFQTKVCSESLDTKFRNCDNSEDLSAILKIFLEIVGIVKKHIFYMSKSENVQEFALKSQK